MSALDAVKDFLVVRPIPFSETEIESDIIELIIRINLYNNSA